MPHWIENLSTTHLILLVLLVLCIEWTVYQRDAVIRIRRGLAGRFGRGAVGGGA